MKLYVLDNGRIENDLANLVAMNALGTVDNKERAAEWIDEPVYSFLIEHPQGLILFDTAAHPDAMTERWAEVNKRNIPYSYREEDLLLNRLAQLGYKPDDIDYVVESHLHCDHAGGLEFFPNSKIIVNDDELKNALKTYAIGTSMGAYIKKDIEQWLAVGLKWCPVDPEEEAFELLPGVTVLNFGPGHTYGMLGLLVELERDGAFILASDTIFTDKNFGPPVVGQGVMYDSIGYVKTIERIRKLQKKYNAKVLYGHDIVQFKTLVTSDKGCYM